MQCNRHFIINNDKADVILIFRSKYKIEFLIFPKIVEFGEKVQCRTSNVTKGLSKKYTFNSVTKLLSIARETSQIDDPIVNKSTL